NSASGFLSLLSNGSSNFNTGVGAVTLLLNTAVEETAVGVGTLLSNTIGANNAGCGACALFTNSTGEFQNAVGASSASLNPGGTGFVGGIFGATATGGLPVVVNADGKLGTVPADSPISMSQVLKQRQIVQELKATTERQAAVIALQEGQIKALTAGLKQQADQIQQVSAQLEMIRPTPRVVENR